MRVSPLASLKALFRGLFAAVFILGVLTTVNAQTSLPYPTDAPIRYEVVETNDPSVHPGAQQHYFIWTRRLKFGELSLSDSSRFDLGVWFSEKSVSYDVGILSFGFNRSDRSILGRKQWSNANVSVDFTSFPIVGDKASILFDALSLDRSFDLTGKRRHPCSGSSVSWQTKSLKWRSIQLNAEGSFDSHTRDFGAWIRVSVYAR